MNVVLLPRRRGRGRGQRRMVSLIRGLIGYTSPDILAASSQVLNVIFNYWVGITTDTHTRRYIQSYRYLSQTVNKQSTNVNTEPTRWLRLLHTVTIYFIWLRMSSVMWIQEIGPLMSCIFKLIPEKKHLRFRICLKYGKGFGVNDIRAVCFRSRLLI